MTTAQTFLLLLEALFLLGMIVPLWLSNRQLNHLGDRLQGLTLEEVVAKVEQRLHRIDRLMMWVAVMWLGWVLSLVGHLFVSVWLRDWPTVGVDVVTLLVLGWIFTRGNWRRWRKRFTERVAVIKDRLVVVPIPNPQGAS